MITKYVYNDSEFHSEYSVRQAIFKNEGLTFGEEPEEGKVEFWSELGVEYKEEPDPEPTKEDLSFAIRQKRDALLSASDFYIVADYPATEEGLKVVKEYRTKLRDITLQETFPFSVEWPEIPSEVSHNVEKLRGIYLV